MDTSLNSIIAANGGFFTRAQALDCGYIDRELRGLLRDGTVRRLRHGIYVRAKTFDALTPSGQHVVLATAVAKSQRGRVALTGPSAAAWHHFSIHGQDVDQVHLIRLDGGSSRGDAGVQHHVLRRDIEDDLEEVNGIWVVKPARAVWELASMSTVEAAVCTADSALRLKAGLGPQLHELRGQFQHRPGSRRARVALSMADGGSESEGESITRIQCFRYGVPRPTLQFKVYDDVGDLVARCDFGWEEERHTGEFDGLVKYERLRRPGESASDVVIREKRREDRVRSQRRGMSRFVWAEVMPRTARKSMARLNHEIEQSHRLYGKGRVIIPL